MFLKINKNNTLFNTVILIMSRIDMKKLTAFIGAILSLIPFGQSLLIQNSVVLFIPALILSLPKKVNAETFEFYFDRAFNKGEKGDHYGAISDFIKAININPEYPEAYYNLGVAKRKLKDYYGAISDYTKAIKINPKYKSGYKNRGIAKELIGDLEGACADWRQTVFLFPNDSAANWLRDQC